MKFTFSQKAFPARIKGLNYYNTGPVFEAFIGIMKPLLSPKLRSRVSRMSASEQVLCDQLLAHCRHSAKSQHLKKTFPDALVIHAG